jgi:hypothetical protein
VTAGGKTYLGILKDSRGPANHIVLDDAMLLLITMQPDPQAGGIRSQIMPSPIPPLQKPCKVELWADSKVDLSKDGEMGEFYARLTGNSGIIIPGFGG